jgi:hypothetical protein
MTVVDHEGEALKLYMNQTDSEIGKAAYELYRLTKAKRGLVELLGSF